MVEYLENENSTVNLENYVILIEDAALQVIIKGNTQLKIIDRSIIPDTQNTILYEYQIIITPDFQNTIS